MAKMVFKVNGGGDRSVGILETEATITIEDNFTEVDKVQLELFREFLREFYDIPKHMGTVLTLEEYEKQQRAEQQFYDEMRTDYEKEREQELTHLNYVADRTILTQE
jgi:hypothetical protein